MDKQRLAGCFLFPTLGVGVEEALLHDPDALHAVFHAFNEWMHDDWTFNYQERIFAAPYICLQDPARAEAEVEYALESGARVVVMRSGPVRGPSFSRSPGDPIYDRMWARIAEAGILAAYHSGDAGYGRYADEWAAAATSRRSATTRSATSPAVTARSTTRSPRSCVTACSAAIRTCASRRSRAAPTGCRCCCTRWRSRTARRRSRTRASIPCSKCATTCGCRRTTRTTCPVLRDELGADQMIFGSDYPHAEGLADPLSFVDDLPGFSDDEIRLVMRENGLALSGELRFIQTPSC